MARKSLRGSFFKLEDAHCVAAQLSALEARLAWRAFSNVHDVSALRCSFSFVVSKAPQRLSFLVISAVVVAVLSSGAMYRLIG